MLQAQIFSLKKPGPSESPQVNADELRCVESILGVKLKSTAEGVRIVEVISNNIVDRHGQAVTTLLNARFMSIGKANTLMYSRVITIPHLINKMVEFSKLGVNNVGLNFQVGRVAKYFLINISELSDCLANPVKVASPAAREPQVNAQSNMPTYSDSLSRGSGDPMKGLNVTQAKAIASGTYYALIIGVDKYSGTWTPLNNAVHDAKAMEAMLRKKYKMDHFYTLYDNQATRSSIMKYFEKLVDTLKADDNVLVYFSGHGEFKKSMNKGYWVPYDAKTNSVSDMISNNDIQTFLASIKSKHTLLISDACFSGDIFRGNTISVPFEESDKYYSKVYNLDSRQALTSGGIEPVMDGGKDGHSVFAYYLLKNLENNTNKYFDIGQLYNSLKVPVVNNSDQTPHLDPIKNTGDEGGQFIFIRK